MVALRKIVLTLNSVSVGMGDGSFTDVEKRVLTGSLPSLENSSLQCDSLYESNRGRMEEGLKLLRRNSTVWRRQR